MYDILTFFLENGLSVVIHKIPNIRTMACGLWIKQGSKHENDLDNGLSHLLEHLMINTNNRMNPEFLNLISDITSEGVIYNAATTKENTSYYFTGLSNMLPKCLETLSRIVINNKTFEEDLVENEKKVVCQEAVSFYSSFNQIKERTSQALWGNTGIGKIIVGSIENIKGAKRDSIEEIIYNTYTPENSTLVIIGDVNYQSIIPVVEDMFSPWEDRKTRMFRETVDEDPGIYFNAGGNGASSAVSIGFRVPSYFDNDRFNIEIIAKILGDTSLESRLAKVIRMERGLAYNLGAFTSFYEKRGTMGFTAVCTNDNIEEVIKLMIAEFKKIKEEGFTEKEINRAKKILETRTLLALDDIVSQLKFLGKYSSCGNIFSLEHEIRKIKEVNNEVLKKSINEIFVQENMGLAAIGTCDIEKLITLLDIE